MDPGELLRVDAAHVWHPYAPAPGRAAAYPVVGARGVRLTLADGRELIDGMSSWWAAIHGYNHPVLNAAIVDQLDSMAHVMFGGLTHPAAVRLAKLLVDMTPAPLTQVFFSDSGSVAVEVAMKMAIQYWSGRGNPGRRRLVTVRGGYHGDTFGAMSVCDPVNGMHHLFARSLVQQLFVDEPAPAFGEEFHDAEMDPLRAVLRQHRDEIAAVIIEPIVQGAGGMRFYAPEFLAQVRRLCDESDVLLIADEIATGFGRTGRLFACEFAGVTPDILCLGKAMTGGYLSMAATLCSEEVARGISASEAGALMHGPTFMGNPLAAAVAFASTQLLLAQPWQRSVERISLGLTEGLAPARGVAGVSDVRVLGAIGVIEARHAIPEQTQALLVDRGVWLRPFGKLLYTMPPYVIDETDLAGICDAMVAAARVCLA